MYMSDVCTGYHSRHNNNNDKGQRFMLKPPFNKDIIS